MSARSMESLKTANAIRMGRSKVRLYIKDDQSRDEAVACLMDPPACCSSLIVFDLLDWVPGVGRFTAMKVCGKARVAERRRLGDLTDRERAALVKALRAA